MLLFTAMLSVVDCYNDLMAGLKSSGAILLRLNFEDWKSEIDTIPGGFDDYAQRHVYEGYSKTILEFEAFLKEEKIAVTVAGHRGSIPAGSHAYLLDYKLACDGGARDRDWWMVYNGFFFRSLKNGCETEYLGTRLPKPSRRKIKKGKVMLRG